MMHDFTQIQRNAQDFTVFGVLSVIIFLSIMAVAIYVLKGQE